MEELLNPTERVFLLRIARQAIESTLQGDALPELNRANLAPTLLQPGATFVTLTRLGELRGCVGALEPYQALVDDVREHAIAAATQDFRFLPLTLSELGQVKIEISRLTLPRDLEYDEPANLPGLLRPHKDGVTLIEGRRRATFLPQVWEKVPDPSDFLEHLCLKLGASPDLWRQQKLRVQVYQVEEFHE